MIPRGSMLHTYIFCSLNAVVSALLLSIHSPDEKMKTRWQQYLGVMAFALCLVSAVHRFWVSGHVDMFWLFTASLPVYIIWPDKGRLLVAGALLLVPFYLVGNVDFHVLSAQYSVMAFSVLLLSMVIYFVNYLVLRKYASLLVPIALDQLIGGIKLYQPVLLFCIFASMLSGVIMHPSLIGVLMLAFVTAGMLILDQLKTIWKVALFVLMLLTLWSIHVA